MSSSAAVDASPLIYLSRAGILELLQLAGDEILVTDCVAREILARGPQDPTAQLMSDTPWIVEVPTPPIPTSVLSWDLGPGESSVIAWVRDHPGCRAVIDDLQGRRCARALGLPLRGTLGLVLRAKRIGQLDRARPVIDRLRIAGMYLSDRVADLALAEVGE
jgi:predicted nucleic acid-binding protein